jgi:hypothetical protein
MLEDTPIARVRSAHQRFVELEGEGQIMKGPPVIGPRTNRPWLWYRYKVEKRAWRTDTLSKNSADWRTVSSGVSDALFQLRDATGRCVIDPDGAEVVPDVSDVWYGNSSQPQFATTTGRNMLSVAMGRYRFTEERLLPGHMYVMRKFQTLNNAEPSLPRAVDTLLRDWKQDQATLFSRIDRNADGEIDLAEREEARKLAEREVLQEHAACASEPVHIRWLDSIQIATYSLFPPPNRRHSFAAIGAFLSWPSRP